MKVLIADDDRTILKVLDRLLRSWNYEVVLAHDGKEAQTILNEDPSIKIAILDWNMPEKTGPEIIREYLKNQTSHSLYTILLTSNTEKQFMVEGIEAGADDFITKPFDVEVLRVRLRAGERIVSSQEQLIERNRTLDDEVQTRTKDLKDALVIAERASEMKSHFLANMSHEIRTPLNGIVSYIELLLYSDLTEEQNHDLLTIRSCTHSLRTIINDVLDFSKIEAGRMLIDHAPFDIKAATEEIVDLLRIGALDKNVELVSTLSVPFTEYVGDKVRFQQILSNLLSNAIKFSPEERAVSILLQENDGSSSQHSVEGGIHLAVSDTGIGIHPSKFKKIFESFTQADSSTTRKYGGTGLGLTIVKKLCEVMGGAVWVQSIEGIGSTFHAVLPFPNIEQQKIINNEVIEADKDFNGLSVLLAEDNLINQQAIKRILEKVGCVVKSANNGYEAVNYFKEYDFSLVLLDIQMPVMGGEEAAMKMKQIMSQRKRVPIVALTANIFEQDLERYIAAGIDEILGKPISFPDLFSVMRRVTDLKEE